jgi:hypothetical protein
MQHWSGEASSVRRSVHRQAALIDARQKATCNL